MKLRQINVRGYTGGNTRIDLNAPLQEVRASEITPGNISLEADSASNDPINLYGISINPKEISLGQSIYRAQVIEADKRIAEKVASTPLYYHTDHLGSSNVITTVTGTSCEEIYYFPYGGTRLDTGSCDVSHKFTGQEEDGETGLYYYGARYYDPVLGRFTSADSIVPDHTNPQSLNRYSYVLNNPLRYIDPTGHSEENPGDMGPGSDTGWGQGSLDGSFEGFLNQFAVALRNEQYLSGVGNRMMAWTYAREYRTTGAGLTPNMYGLENLVSTIFERVTGEDAIITFTTNGTHKSSSLHPSGNAIDIRARDLSQTQIQQIEQQLNDAIGKAGYYVEFEVNDAPHFHIEYKGK